MSVTQEDININININNNHENDLSFFDEKDIPYEKYEELIESIQKLNENIKNIQLDKQKDYDRYEKNVNYLLGKFREIKITELSFFNRTISDVKKNIKMEKKKKNENKDKSKYFVNLQKTAPSFVLEMMNKKQDETVSQSQVLNSLIQLIKKCMNDDFNNFVVYKENGKIDNTKFQIKGVLLSFFNEIKNEASKRGDTIHIPEQLGYPNLMSYLKYVIYK